jgi:hypothetical protein
VVRQDYFERLIQQLAGAIARIAGFVADGKYEDASREIEASYRSLGLTPGMVGRLEPATLCALLGRGKLDAVASVLDAEAGLLRAQGRDAEAQGKSRDAEDLRRAGAEPTDASRSGNGDR